MKTNTYTILLLIFAAFIIPDKASSQIFVRKRASNYKKSEVEVQRKNDENPRMGRAATTLKTLRTEADSIESGKRENLTGIAKPDPNIYGYSNVVRRKNGNIERLGKDNIDGDERTHGKEKITIRKEYPYTNELSGLISQTGEYYQVPTEGMKNPIQFLQVNNLTLMDDTDKAFFKKFSVVLGAFSIENNAYFVKRTFNALGERTIVVKSADGKYLAMLVGGDTQAEASMKLVTFTNKYVGKESRAKRVNKWGVSLDDLWILIKE